MKQSAAKTLGVAALGAAFAAAGAGVASAAPAPAPAVPDVAGLGTVTQALPTGGVTRTLPGAGEALGQGQNALGATVDAARPTAERAIADGPAAPVGGLLGGLPVKGAPHGLPVNGIPLG